MLPLHALTLTVPWARGSHLQRGETGILFSEEFYQQFPANIKQLLWWGKDKPIGKPEKWHSSRGEPLNLLHKPHQTQAQGYLVPVMIFLKGLGLWTQMVSSRPQQVPKWGHALLRAQPHKRERGLLADTHSQVHPVSTHSTGYNQSQSSQVGDLPRRQGNSSPELTPHFALNSTPLNDSLRDSWGLSL